MTIWNQNSNVNPLVNNLTLGWLFFAFEKNLLCWPGFEPRLPDLRPGTLRQQKFRFDLCPHNNLRPIVFCCTKSRDFPVLSTLARASRAPLAASQCIQSILVRQRNCETDCYVRKTLQIETDPGTAFQRDSPPVGNTLICATSVFISPFLPNDQRSQSAEERLILLEIVL